MTITQVLIGLYFTCTSTSSTILIDKRIHSSLAHLEVASSNLVKFKEFLKIVINIFIIVLTKISNKFL